MYNELYWKSRFVILLEYPGSKFGIPDFSGKSDENLTVSGKHCTRVWQPWEILSHVWDLGIGGL